MRRIVAVVTVFFASVSSAFAGNAWEVFPIATGPLDQVSPAISGGIVVWSEGSFDSWDIYGRSLATGRTFPICTAAGAQVWPSVSGDIVVWEDRRNGDPDYEGDVYGYDLSKGQEFIVYQHAGPMLLASRPQISGDWVAWSEYRFEDGGYSAYARNLSTQQEKRLRTVSDEPAGGLQLRNNVAVWYDFTAAQGHSDVLGYDLATDSPLTVCTKPRNQGDPSTDGRTIVWADTCAEDAFRGNIGGLDLETGLSFTIDSDSGEVWEPDVQGDLVVWATNSDLYGHYLSTGETFLIAKNVNAQCPKISGDYIVWTTCDSATGEFDVYGARQVPEPCSLGLLASATFVLLTFGCRKGMRLTPLHTGD